MAEKGIMEEVTAGLMGILDGLDWVLTIRPKRAEKKRQKGKSRPKKGDERVRDPADDPPAGGDHE